MTEGELNAVATLPKYDESNSFKGRKGQVSAVISRSKRFELHRGPYRRSGKVRGGNQQGGSMRGQKGLTLLEVVIAIAVLGILAVGFLSSLGTASKTLALTDERQTAKNLLEREMEYIRRQSLSPTLTYTTEGTLPAEYAGYTVLPPVALDITPAGGTVEMHEITLTVTRNGRQFDLTDYKVGR
jgi:prepilin-type N-terminal cleavage/methylation domain-containing protein